MIIVDYSAETGIVRFTCSGELELASVMDAATGLDASAVAGPDGAFSTLWDLRDCRWEKAAADFSSLRQFVVARINEAHPAGRVAILCNTMTEASMINAHYAGQGWQAQWRGFTDERTAIVWLTDATGPETA